MGLSGSKLYRLSGSTVIPASEALYPAEADLQQLIAENPQLLLSSPNEGQRLYLLRREQPVRDAPDGPALFSIDHLFIDQDGLPVLVEVKRSTDTRIRREVVGQMLDYASRMRAWSASELRSSASLLDVPDDLWAALDGNLKAERMRLIFAADSIPDSLASMIDFLDRSMDAIEVCGVEIKRYVSEDGAELISSTIVGGGNSPVKRAARYSTIWDADSMAEQLNQRENSAIVPVVAALTSFASSAGLQISYGRGTKFGVCRALRNGRKVFSVTSWEKGHTGLRTAVEVSLPSLVDQTCGTFEEGALRSMLLTFPDASPADAEQFIFGSSQFQYIDLRLLAEPSNLSHFQNAITQIVQAIPEE